VAARTLAPLIAIAIVMSLAVAPACGSIQPEVGERLPACVDADSNPGQKVDFKTQIRPIMTGIPDGPKPCANCHYHSTGTMDGLNATQLDLESVILMKKGGTRTSGTAIVPGQPCSSAIVQKLRGTFEGARMPRGGPYWSPEQIQLMTDWIAEGAMAKDDE
jgi:hypothetical protein